MKIEQRFCSVGIRSADDAPGSIVGLASVYYRDGDKGTEYSPYPGVAERVAPGAYDAILEDRSHEVVALVNHDPNLVIGRRSAGTLHLFGTSEGLAYKISPPDTTVTADLRANLEAGNITGSSIGFLPASDGLEYSREGDVQVRTITKVGFLRDVGPVTIPAFGATEAMQRSLETAFEEHEHAQRRTVYFSMAERILRN